MNCIAVLDPKSSFNSGKISGLITFHQCSPATNTQVSFNLSGFKPHTVHGVHVHKLGDLSKGCQSLCEHFSAITGQPHGSSYLYGASRHTGDLCSNIRADANGKVDFTYVDDLVDLYGSCSIIGRSVVIHDKEDDLGRYRDENSERGKGSRTTGNAGGRIACAVIGLTDSDFHKYIN